MKAQQTRDAREEILVERDDGGERLTGLRVTQPQPMFASRVGDDDVAPFDTRQVGE